jgi:hypothetical protein
MVYNKVVPKNTFAHEIEYKVKSTQNAVQNSSVIW